MSKLIKIDNTYADWIKDLSLRFRQSQIKAAVKVNSEMLKFYFSLGADIVTKQAESKWGKGFFSTLSQDLQNLLPEAKCFSETNLRYMKRFYQLYFNKLVILPQGGAELGDSNNPKLPQLGAEKEIVPQDVGNLEICPQPGDETIPQVVEHLF